MSSGLDQTSTSNVYPLHPTRYLSAKSVSQKGDFTWAGQNFGSFMQSDGRPAGSESIENAVCTNQICTIRVPAPAVALVFLYPSSLTETAGAAKHTFSTTARTNRHNTATVDPAVLATSNGHTGMDGLLGSTSAGSVSGSEKLHMYVGGFCAFIMGLAGVMLLLGNSV